MSSFFIGTDAGSHDDGPEPPEPAERAWPTGPAKVDARALGELCEVLAPAVFGWAVLRIPSTLQQRIDPEDVVQEVLCRVLTRGAEFDPARGDARAWVFGFARHVLHEGLRNCARDAAGSERVSYTELALVPEHATTLTRRVARAEIMRTFAERVGGLDGEDRKLLLLRGLEGLEHEAVARELRISAPACAKRWQRLRESLGHELEVLLSA